MNSKGIKIIENRGRGIGGLVEEKEWTAMILNYMPSLSADHISEIHCHELTDESFILLRGHAVLFINKEQKSSGKLEAFSLEKNKIYHVLKGTWHTQVLKRGTKVLLIENSDTKSDNSPRTKLTHTQKEYIEEYIQKKAEK